MSFCEVCSRSVIFKTFLGSPLFFYSFYLARDLSDCDYIWFGQFTLNIVRRIGYWYGLAQCLSWNSYQTSFSQMTNLSHTIEYTAYPGGKGALSYKPEGRGFVFPIRSLDFSIYLILPEALWPPGSTQPLTEMSTRNHSGGKWRPVHTDDNLTAIC
jgi:hypothetical protein